MIEIVTYVLASFVYNYTHRCMLYAHWQLLVINNIISSFLWCVSGPGKLRHMGVVVVVGTK